MASVCRDTGCGRTFPGWQRGEFGVLDMLKMQIAVFDHFELDLERTRSDVMERGIFFTLFLLRPWCRLRNLRHLLDRMTLRFEVTKPLQYKLQYILLL